MSTHVVVIRVQGVRYIEPFADKYGYRRNQTPKNFSFYRRTAPITWDETTIIQLEISLMACE